MKPPPPLSPRETEIMNLISEGLRDLEIADVLKISRNTVDAHKRHIFAKMSASNIAKAVADFTLGVILQQQTTSIKNEHSHRKQAAAKLTQKQNRLGKP